MKGKLYLQVYDNTDWSMVESLNDTVDITNLYLQFTVQFAHRWLVKSIV